MTIVTESRNIAFIIQTIAFAYIYLKLEPKNGTWDKIVV